MVCDGVANIVIRLQESGFDPRKVGPDSWESRCPAHRSAECTLSITRDEHNHVLLECRSTQNCQNAQIFAALGFPNDRLYAETPDWLISRLGRVPIRPASFASPDATDSKLAGACAVEGPEGSDGTSPPDERVPGADRLPRAATARRMPCRANSRSAPRAIPCHLRHTHHCRSPRQSGQTRSLSRCSAAPWNSTYRILH